VDPTGHERTVFKQAGDFFEALFSKSTQDFIKGTIVETITGKRIPDFVSEKAIAELKNVSYQYLSRQIQGLMDHAKGQGKEFMLVLREGAKISQSLWEAMQEEGRSLWVLTSEGLRRATVVAGNVVEGLMVVPQFFLDEFKKQAGEMEASAT
jgi:hypothetical protein